LGFGGGVDGGYGFGGGMVRGIRVVDHREGTAVEVAAVLDVDESVVESVDESVAVAVAAVVVVVVVVVVTVVEKVSLVIMPVCADVDVGVAW